MVFVIFSDTFDAPVDDGIILPISRSCNLFVRTSVVGTSVSFAMLVPGL